MFPAVLWGATFNKAASYLARLWVLTSNFGWDGHVAEPPKYLDG